MATVSNFPSKATVTRNREIPKPPDFSKATSSQQYEDGGMAFNSANSTGELVWEIGYEGLTSAQWAILDAHFAEAQLHNDFTFVDRAGVSHTGVRYQEFDNDFTKQKNQSRTVKLIKYP